MHHVSKTQTLTPVFRVTMTLVNITMSHTDSFTWTNCSSLHRGKVIKLWQTTTMEIQMFSRKQFSPLSRPWVKLLQASLQWQIQKGFHGTPIWRAALESTMHNHSTYTTLTLVRTSARFNHVAKNASVGAWKIPWLQCWCTWELILCMHNVCIKNVFWEAHTMSMPRS